MPVTIQVKNFQSIHNAKIVVDHLTVVTGTNNAGKALAHGTKVATPSGWVPVECLERGQMVLAGDGTPTPITGVFPQGGRKVCTITFDDGRHVTVDEDHQWKVCFGARRFPRAGGDQQWETLTTSQIRFRVGDSPTGTQRPAIPVAGVAEFEPQDQPLDPYLLGALLGDGSFRGTISISSADAEVIHQVVTLVPTGVTLRKWGKYDYSLVTGRGYRNPVLSAIRGLGLEGCLSPDKWVPDIYLFGSPLQRVALLQGLMDTDGSVNHAGTAEFYSSSERLARSVSHLVYSLGGTARVRRKEKTTYTYKGESRTGLPAYTVTFRVPSVDIFRLKRKAVLLVPLVRRVQPLMATFEDVGSAECTCITVDHSSHLFQVEGHLVTHNTALQRAVRGVFQNTGGTAFIRDGETTCSVEVDFGADGKIKWLKGTGKRDRPTYTINDGEPIYPGSAVPDEVAAFGVTSIPAGGQDVWPTIAPQFTGQMFLIDRPGSALAEAIADVERVGQLNRALRAAESDRRQASSALKVRRTDLVKHEADLSAFAGLDDAVAVVHALENQRSDVVKVGRAVEGLTDIRTRLSAAKEVALNLAPVADVQVPVHTDAEATLTRMVDLEDTRERLVSARGTVAKYGGIDKVMVNVDVGLPQRVLAALDVLVDIKSRISKVKSAMTTRMDDLAEAGDELSEATGMADVALVEMGTCPLCGSRT